jgi:outer membrane protein assembly factor BamD
MKRISLLSLFTLLLLFGSSCKNPNLIRPGEPLDSAYKKAMTLYERERYGDAINAFETITRVGRGTEFAQDAQYYLAEAYYKNNEFLLASSEYERFVAFYPNDNRREEVDFKIALCYMELSPRYKLDQSDTIRALEAFQLFNNRYPDSPLVLESAKYIDELRSKLARKYYMAADFYLRTDRYEAAAIYFGLTIDQFPESELAEDALMRQIETYVVYAEKSISDKQAERYQKAIDGYNKFLQLFPRSDNRAEVENLRDKALAGLRSIEAGEEESENLAES